MDKYIVIKDIPNVGGVGVKRGTILIRIGDWLFDGKKMVTGYDSYYQREHTIPYKEKEASKHQTNKILLPDDVKEVYINNSNVTVVLTNGNKGTSICMKSDEFDAYTGFCIAYYKAHNSKNFELKRAFQNCMNYAKKKGYKQAILKND